MHASLEGSTNTMYILCTQISITDDNIRLSLVRVDFLNLKDNSTFQVQISIIIMSYW